jgi:hypothetical protein
MKMFLDGNEVNTDELKEALSLLDYGEFDGGTFEIITLDLIDKDGNMYFNTEKYSTFGG